MSAEVMPTSLNASSFETVSDNYAGYLETFLYTAAAVWTSSVASSVHNDQVRWIMLCVVPTLMIFVQPPYLMIACLSITAFRMVSKPASYRPRKFDTAALKKVARHGVLLWTVILILAADSQYFPSKHLKSRGYGISTMDLGIGMFNLMTGAERATGRNRKPSILLLILGVLRPLAFNFFNYQTDFHEYGIHCNSFISLYFTSFISTFMLDVTGWHPVFLCTMCSIGHWFQLRANSLESIENLPPLIRKNWPCLISTMGLVALQHAGHAFTLILLERTANTGHPGNFEFSPECFSMLSTMISMLVLRLRHSRFSLLPPHRAYCDVAYILTVYSNWSLAVTLAYFFSGFYRSEFQQPNAMPNGIGGILFIVANLLTGIVNLCFDLKSFFLPVAIFTLIAYSYTAYNLAEYILLSIHHGF